MSPEKPRERLDKHASIKKITTLAIISFLCACSEGDFNEVCSETKSKIADMQIISLSSADEKEDDDKIKTYLDKLSSFATGNGINIDFVRNGIGYGIMNITLPNGEKITPIDFVCNQEGIESIKANKDTAYHLKLLIKWQHLTVEQKVKEDKMIRIIAEMTLDEMIKLEEEKLMQSLR